MKRIQGTVVRGEGWGRKLGYPTANLQKPTARKLPLPNGVYAAYAHIGVRGKARKAILLVGAPAFFQKNCKKLEVYLLDFSGDLVGKHVTVDVIKKIRTMKRFVNSGELIAQIEQDIQEAQRILT